MSSYHREVASGKRFEFGKNWSRFLALLDEERILEAEKSLKHMLAIQSLQGKSFLDIGSGSGLFSLAARRLGATVYSFDYDPHSVACTRELKSRYFRDDNRWTVEEGSVLDIDFVKSLNQFDIVYAWGVLHHTGEMWKALDVAARPVKKAGHLFIMVYLDRGWQSVFWRQVKRFYCSGPLGQATTVSIFIPYFVLRGILEDVLRLKNPIRRYRDYKTKRGMSKFHDWIDWLGGYPYEVAKPEEIIEFYRERDFTLKKIERTQYVFERL